MTQKTEPLTLLKYLCFIFGGAGLMAAGSILTLHLQEIKDNPPTRPQIDHGANVAQNVAATVSALPQFAAQKIEERAQWARDYNALSAACDGLQKEVSALLTARGVSGTFKTVHEIKNIDIEEKKYGECVVSYNDKFLAIFNHSAALEGSWYRDRINSKLTAALDMEDLKKLSTPILAPR